MQLVCGLQLAECKSSVWVTSEVEIFKIVHMAKGLRTPECHTHTHMWLQTVATMLGANIWIGCLCLLWHYSVHSHSLCPRFHCPTSVFDLAYALLSSGNLPRSMEVIITVRSLSGGTWFSLYLLLSLTLVRQVDCLEWQKWYVYLWFHFIISFVHFPTLFLKKISNKRQLLFGQCKKINLE